MHTLEAVHIGRKLAHTQGLSEDLTESVYLGTSQATPRLAIQASRHCTA